MYICPVAAPSLQTGTHHKTYSGSSWTANTTSHSWSGHPGPSCQWCWQMYSSTGRLRRQTWSPHTLWDSASWLSCPDAGSTPVEVAAEDTRRMFLEATSGAGCHLEGKIWFCIYWFFIINLLNNNEKEFDKHAIRGRIIKS